MGEEQEREDNSGVDAVDPEREKGESEVREVACGLELRDELGMRVRMGDVHETIWWEEAAHGPIVGRPRRTCCKCGTLCLAAAEGNRNGAVRAASTIGGEQSNFKL